MSNKALREAFLEGVRYGQLWYPGPVTDAEAKRRYPPKTETRPREVAVTFKGGDTSTPDVSYRFVDGQYEIDFYDDQGWVRAASIQVDGGNIIVDPFAFTPETVAELLELFDNPTETVEVDD